MEGDPTFGDHVEGIRFAAINKFPEVRNISVQQVIGQSGRLLVWMDFGDENVGYTVWDCKTCSFINPTER